MIFTFRTWLPSARLLGCDLGKEFRRQVLFLNNFLLAESAGVLNGTPQLTDIAGPGILKEGPRDIIGQTLNVLV